MQIVSAGADTAGHEKRSLLEAYAFATHADAWAALSLWITAAIAGGALLFASRQVNEARATRKAVAQPNVVVYVDLNPGDWQYLDLVVKNFGQTPAYGIRFVGLPDLDVVPWENLLTGDHETALHVPETIVVLAAGQECPLVPLARTRHRQASRQPGLDAHRPAAQTSEPPTTLSSRRDRPSRHRAARAVPPPLRASPCCPRCHTPSETPGATCGLLGRRACILTSRTRERSAPTPSGAERAQIHWLEPKFGDTAVLQRPSPTTATALRSSVRSSSMTPRSSRASRAAWSMLGWWFVITGDHREPLPPPARPATPAQLTSSRPDACQA